VCGGLEVSKYHWKGYAYTAIYFGAEWEVEHNIGVLVHPTWDPIYGFDVMDCIIAKDNPEAQSAVAPGVELPALLSGLRAINGILETIKDEETARRAESELLRLADEQGQLLDSMIDRLQASDPATLAVFADRHYCEARAIFGQEKMRIEKDVPTAIGSLLRLARALTPNIFRPQRRNRHTLRSALRATSEYLSGRLRAMWKKSGTDRRDDR